LEINNLQRTILQSFATLSGAKQSFYLTGGTALSLFYLHHRKSYDLDVFTADAELIVPFSDELTDTLKSMGIAVDRKRALRSFVELNAMYQNEQTIIHLAIDSPYRIEEPVTFEGYPDLHVDGLKDIAANKMLALFGRALPRDFLDVYFLSRTFEKEELMTLARRKDPGFDLYWFGASLERISQFTENTFEMHILLQPMSYEAVREFFASWQVQVTAELKK